MSIHSKLYQNRTVIKCSKLMGEILWRKMLRRCYMSEGHSSKVLKIRGENCGRRCYVDVICQKVTVVKC